MSSKKTRGGSGNNPARLSGVGHDAPVVEEEDEERAGIQANIVPEGEEDTELGMASRDAAESIAEERRKFLEEKKKFEEERAAFAEEKSKQAASNEKSLADKSKREAAKSEKENLVDMRSVVATHGGRHYGPGVVSAPSEAVAQALITARNKSENDAVEVRRRIRDEMTSIVEPVMAAGSSGPVATEAPVVVEET